MGHSNGCLQSKCPQSRSVSTNMCLDIPIKHCLSCLKYYLTNHSCKRKKKQFDQDIHHKMSFNNTMVLIYSNVKTWILTNLILKMFTTCACSEVLIKKVNKFICWKPFICKFMLHDSKSTIFCT